MLTLWRPLLRDLSVKDSSCSQQSHSIGSPKHSAHNRFFVKTNKKKCWRLPTPPPPPPSLHILVVIIYGNGQSLFLPSLLLLLLDPPSPPQAKTIIKKMLQERKARAGWDARNSKKVLARAVFSFGHYTVIFNVGQTDLEERLGDIHKRQLKNQTSDATRVGGILLVENRPIDREGFLFR